MQILKVSEIFKNIINIDNTEFEKANKINLDFSNIESIDLTGIKMLLKLQKVALLNNKSLSISNVNPNIDHILDVTGLNKTFDNLSYGNLYNTNQGIVDNPIKRQIK